MPLVDPSPISVLNGTRYNTLSGLNTIIDLIYTTVPEFRNEADLLACICIGIEESSMSSQARRWHASDYGFRPAGDVLGVTNLSANPAPDLAYTNNAVVATNDPNVTRVAPPPYGQQVNSDRGMWQISSHWFPAYTDATCDTPALALAGPVRDIKLVGDGRGWLQWDPYLNGNAQTHYDAALNGWPAMRPLVQAYLATKWSSGGRKRHHRRTR